MPNWCFTNYVITGDETEISDLYDKLSSLPDREDVHENGFGKFWLGNVIGLFGGDWNSIKCRGSMDNLEKKSPTEITLFTETAWGDLPQVWDFVFQSYKTLKYYFLAQEPGNVYYATNDSDGLYFPERYLVDQWGVDYKEFRTRDDVMQEVAVRIGLSIESWEDMEAKIETFNEVNEDNEITVNEIKVE